MNFPPFLPPLAYLDRCTVADARLLNLQRGYHARLMSHVVLARVKLLGEKRLRQRLESAPGTTNEERGEIFSQSAI